MNKGCAAVPSTLSLSAAAAVAADVAADEVSAALLRRFVDGRRSTEKSARGSDESRRNLWRAPVDDDDDAPRSMLRRSLLPVVDRGTTPVQLSRRPLDHDVVGASS